MGGRGRDRGPHGGAHPWREPTPQGKMRSLHPSGPESLGRVLDDLLQRGAGEARQARKLTQRWLAAVGEEIGRVTRLERIRDGVLTVSVASPAWLQELAAFRRDEILDRLNASGEAPRIRDLRFRNGTFE